MSAALENLVRVIQRSGLLEKEVVAARLAEFRAQATTHTPERFASHLVEAEVLTPWQASKLLQGKHKGFFLGKYRLLKLLGKGGMSSVYLAEHSVLRRRCAIKVLPWKMVHDQGFLQRFHREARAGAALDHPHIVRAFDVDQQIEGNLEIHFLVMEFVDGRNLYDLVAGSGPLSAVTAARFMRQGALGLAHAHAAGIIHRDVKPGNFIVDQQGVVKLTDLGLARTEQPDRDRSLTVQFDQKIIGTADYLSPEQAVDSHLVDHRSDLYSLGCTFHFLLTGRAPFADGTLTQRLLAHQTQAPPDVSQLRSDVPESLSRILQQLLAKRPEDRPQSAEAVATMLGQWLAEQGETDQIATDPRTWRAAVPVEFRPAAQAGALAVESPSTPTPAAQETLWKHDPELEDFLSSLTAQQPPSFVRSKARKQRSAEATSVNGEDFQPSGSASGVLDEDLTGPPHSQIKNGDPEDPFLELDTPTEPAAPADVMLDLGRLAILLLILGLLGGAAMWLAALLL